MNFINNTQFALDFIDIDPQIAAALIGILSMVVARLLDWYFPSKHHRKLDDDEDDDKDDDNEDREIV